MNRAVNRLAFAGLLLALSCNGSNILTLGQSYTLQGIVADAVTGARIGGDLKLYLVQGPEVRGPSRLTTSGDLSGEYAFTGIPVAYHAGNNVWKVVAVKSGYQRFESEITFTASTLDLSATNAVVDQAFSKIGNIYLFPEGAAAPDYTFAALYNGKPVAGATIQLDPISASNSNTFVNGGAGDTLPATNGYVASLAQTTDASGKAVFAGGTLAVGAMYKIEVLPVVFKETASATPITLGLLTFPTTGGGALFVLAGIGGAAATYVTLSLGDLTPATTAEPIYIVDASNRALDQLQPNGTLQVTFNLPVSLVNPNNFGGSIVGLKADGTTPSTAALNSTQPVTASLDPTGTILTLAPNYTGSGGQAPAATDRDVTITYTPTGPAAGGGGLVAPKDYPAKTFNVFGLKFGDGSALSDTVRVSAP